MAQYFTKNSIFIKGSPDRFRDFVYIDDVVESFMKASTVESSNHIINIGSGEKVTVRNLVDSMLKPEGKSFDSYDISYGENTPGDIFGIWSDVSLAEKNLGWVPQVKLRVGMERMMNWAKEVYS